MRRTFVLTLVEDDRLARLDPVHEGGVHGEVLADPLPKLAPAGPAARAHVEEQPDNAGRQQPERIRKAEPLLDTSSCGADNRQRNEK